MSPRLRVIPLFLSSCIWLIRSAQPLLGLFMRYHPAFEKLRDCFARLPGIGRRSAERLVFGLLTDQTGLSKELIAALQEMAAGLRCCSRCGALTPVADDPCRLCMDPTRDATLLCVVEAPSDIMRIEQAGGYRGHYHALMGRLSPMSGLGMQDLRMNALFERINQGAFREIILALNSNVESDATASFIRSRLAGRNLLVSRPAMGIPAGGGVAYADALTLANAMKSRQAF
jgi:recombination protein RecR